MMWQPNTREAAVAIVAVTEREGTLEEEIWATLRASGALSEINRLTALLAMKDETINTLRTQLHKATTTTLDDYDSGYRAA